jgi:hypothetical protein
MTLLLAISIVWLVPSCVLASRTYSTSWGWLFIFCAVPGAYVLYHFFGSHARRLKHQLERERHDEETGRYQEIARLWQEMEYCGRCHGVYLPGNEWQRAVNPDLNLISPDNAWGYAQQLTQYLWGLRNETVVTDKGVIERPR